MSAGARGAATAWAVRAALWLSPALLAAGCFSPPVQLGTTRQPLDLQRFPAGTQAVELRADDATVLRGVYLDAGPGSPVVVSFPESGGVVTRGSRAMGVSLNHLNVTGSGGVADPPPDLAPPDAPDERHLEMQPTWYGVFDRMLALGASVLAVDPTGIGSSDGMRDAAHIRRDAHLVWDEALRRAGGDPSRVLLRGTSLGTLSVACLLQDGVRPGAVILVAPVRAETVVRNGGRLFYGDVLGTLGALFFRDPVSADLLAEIEQVQVPLLVVVPRADVFLPADEQRLLREAVERARGTFLVRDDDHVELALAGRQLLAAERWFLVREGIVDDPRTRLDDELARWRSALGDATSVRVGTRDLPADALDPGHPARARLEWLLRDVPPRAPGVAAALALAALDEKEQRSTRDALDRLPVATLARLDVVALACLCALDDPAHRLPPSSFECGWVAPDLGDEARLREVLDAFGRPMRPPEPGRVIFSFSGDGSFEFYDKEPEVITNVDSYVRRGYARADARRLVARTLFDGVLLASRIPAGEGHGRDLEVLVNGRWKAVSIGDQGVPVLAEDARPASPAVGAAASASQAPIVP